jgi:hypothetical protein
MISSGTTASFTSDDTAITLLAASAYSYTQLVILNESGIAGFFSIDGGTTWARWADGAKALTIPLTERSQAIKFKRVASGANVTGLWAFAV